MGAPTCHGVRAVQETGWRSLQLEAEWKHLALLGRVQLQKDGESVRGVGDIRSLLWGRMSWRQMRAGLLGRGPEGGVRLEGKKAVPHVDLCGPPLAPCWSHTTHRHLVTEYN